MALYRIQRFSKLTGISTHVIRAWEKRYGLVDPTRGANRYRLYKDEDVRLFRYLKSQVDQGMSIGQLAETGRETLLRLAQQDWVRSAAETPHSEGLISELIQAIQEGNRLIFQRKLNGALAVIPFEEALHRFLLPLQERVGQLWHDGVMGVAQEHFVSNQVKQKIFSALNQFQLSEGDPHVVVACPAQEWHEISAMTAAYLCAVRGCRVHYLGANLPIPELAKFCEQFRPSYVLLSLTVDRTLTEARMMVKELTSLVKPLAPIGVGGQFAQAHSSLFLNEKITVFSDMSSLDAFVHSLPH
ncbi:MerR family transcriptional regulator [Candidatus Nitrospira neomarina]|uniref:MerR family transcriptional regulator n=1 Tax=Candidatus Nitrospira neomarina TaxID=3020899 RepID=A0AA96GHE9_9BACT|nr:MerR family transcriptional regulator [Candidatus Nitrospira neomarina]WNM60215.1 MerR family transcriptional regulator [Candidatus Nitrospira neomarina]